MKPITSLRAVAVTLAVGAVLLAAQALLADASAADGRKCPRGVRQCSAAQVGQPCDPSNPSLICSAQANGSYCCLAYAP